MIFVDTNYFLRFLLADNAEQFKQAKKIFTEGANDQKSLLTSTIVIFEIYWVLSSYYGKNKSDLIDILQKILGLEFVGLPERAVLCDALKYFQAESLSFEDCYNLAYAKEKNAGAMKTFDKKLLKVFERLNIV